MIQKRLRWLFYPYGKLILRRKVVCSIFRNATCHPIFQQQSHMSIVVAWRWSIGQVLNVSDRFCLQNNRSRAQETKHLQKLFTTNIWETNSTNSFCLHLFFLTKTECYTNQTQFSVFLSKCQKDIYYWGHKNLPFRLQMCQLLKFDKNVSWILQVPWRNWIPWHFSVEDFLIKRFKVNSSIVVVFKDAQTPTGI